MKIACFFYFFTGDVGAVPVPGIGDDSGESESEDEEIKGPGNTQAPDAANADNIETTKASKAAEEISALINYVQAVRFHGFELSESKHNLQYFLFGFYTRLPLRSKRQDVLI